MPGKLQRESGAQHPASGRGFEGGVHGAVTVWLHVPAAVWGLVELMHWPCRLTPLEQSLRLAAGQAGYRGGFVEHYLLPIIYPAGFTPQIQVVLGLIVLLLNGLIYTAILRQRWPRP